VTEFLLSRHSYRIFFCFQRMSNDWDVSHVTANDTFVQIRIRRDRQSTIKGTQFGRVIRLQSHRFSLFLRKLYGETVSLSSGLSRRCILHVAFIYHPHPQVHHAFCHPSSRNLTYFTYFEMSIESAVSFSSIYRMSFSPSSQNIK
jgi:hypothetical protein